MFDDDDYLQFYLAMLLVTLTALTLGGRKLLNYAHASNRLEFNDDWKNTIGGLIELYVWAVLLESKTPLNIPPDGRKIVTNGPHNFGMDGVLLSAHMQGVPPRFYATTVHDHIWGVKRFLEFFNRIPVDPAKKDAIAAATKVLAEEDACVALLPQGNLCYQGREPSIVFSGAATLAVDNNTKIYVVRSDGHWLIHNKWIPQSLRNHFAYRLLLAMFLPNKVRNTLCCVIDPNDPQLPLDREEKIQEINARLDAYYRPLGDLTPQQIAKIGEQIEAGNHRPIWENRRDRFFKKKELAVLEKEYQQLNQEQSQALALT